MPTCPDSPNYPPYLGQCPSPVIFGLSWSELGLCALVLLGLVILIRGSVRIIQQYERGVIFRLGRVVNRVRNPGLAFKVPFIDRLEKVDLQVQTLKLSSQALVTRDSVSVDVIAVLYCRVIDPIQYEVEIEDPEEAVEQLGQAIVRRLVGTYDLADILIQSQAITATIAKELNETVGQWGIGVSKLEIKDIKLPKDIRRAMAAKAEAVRLADAKVVAADGEINSAGKLAAAAAILAGQPGAMDLRRLETLREIGAEHNTVVVMDSGASPVAAQAAAGQIAGHNTASPSD